MLEELRRQTRRQKGAVQTPAWRRELKYAISEAKAASLVRFIEPYLNRDRYSELHPGGAYPVLSLYLDSEDLRLCRESLEGHKNRFKLRIRSYTDNVDYPRFFEIKRRANAVIIKNRARVRHDDIAAVLSGLSMPREVYKTDGEVLSQFQLYVSSIGARPVVKVRYLRQAFEDDSDHRVRVTLDRDLFFGLADGPDLSLSSTGWQRHHVKGVILEIKFTGRYPAWLSRMVTCFNLRQQSISKYASSMKKAGSLRFCGPRLPLRMH